MQRKKNAPEKENNNLERTIRKYFFLPGNIDSEILKIRRNWPYQNVRENKVNRMYRGCDA